MYFPEGVGKSSLISTFVSRQFASSVPGIMTRVQLPPDPRSSSITTIVDSQIGDRAIMEGTMEHVDAIVLVYDLSREETFCRLEEHWLPLVERMYEGKVCASPSSINYLLTRFLRSLSLWPKIKWISF